MKSINLKNRKGNIMKNLHLLIAGLSLFATTAFAQLQTDATSLHGGGNGGDDYELELKKRALQIGYFIKSSVGSKVFNSLNADAVIEAIEKTDIDVVSGNVVDKYGVIRTCVNESTRSLITCNLARLEQLKKSNQHDILTAMLFHEILGIMDLELGYQENVSMYPVSSKIIPYHSVVEATPVSEANIRPEYFGLDNASYGISIVNKTTKESIRMICLNDNVEIHRCRNFSVVRMANGRQAPISPEIVSVSPTELSKIILENAVEDSIGTSVFGKKEREAIKIAKKVFNLDNNLSLIGTSETISKNEVFEMVIKFLKLGLMEKINLPARLQKQKEIEEAKQGPRRAADNTRKDNELMEQIGDFSVTFKKDFVMLANKESHYVWGSTTYIQGKYTISCRINFPSQDISDRIIPQDTTFRVDLSSSIKPYGITPNKEFVIVAPTVRYGSTRLSFECVTNSDSSKDYRLTVKEFKQLYNAIIDVNILEARKI